MSLTNIQINATNVLGSVSGVGNVYYVYSDNDTAVGAELNRRFGGALYDDGSPILFKASATAADVAIQAALDACVASRNDYVIIMPSAADYDLTATLTMSKKAVHLICPAGFGSNGIGMNAARLDCTVDVPAVTITGDCVEFGGFFIKGFLNGGSCILLSGTRWHANIHDNFVGIKASSAGSANYGIFGAAACCHMSIHHNYVTNYSPSAMTGGDNVIAGAIAFTSTSCTRNVISDNIITTGANTTMALGISDVGDQAMILRNHVFECPAFSGVYDASTLTVGINSSVTSFVADNRIGIVTAANAVVGGTADSSYCCTYEASSGATAAT